MDTSSHFSQNSDCVEGRIPKLNVAVATLLKTEN